jgi:hypothetical protein
MEKNTIYMQNVLYLNQRFSTDGSWKISNGLFNLYAGP